MINYLQFVAEQFSILMPSDVCMQKWHRDCKIVLSLWGRLSKRQTN